MNEAACPSVHVTSDVTAAFLSQPPTSDKALMDRQQSLGYYARTDDVSDVLLGAGNDYFHQHRRHQFRQVSVPLRQQDVQLVGTAATPAPLDFTGTCRPDVEHIYESPIHDGPRSPPPPANPTGRPLEDSYYSEQNLKITTS